MIELQEDLQAIRDTTQIKRFALVRGKPVPVRLEITAPRNSQVGSNFHLTAEQGVEGEVTGCYTVVVSIV